MTARDCPDSTSAPVLFSLFPPASMSASHCFPSLLVPLLLLLGLVVAGQVRFSHGQQPSQHYMAAHNRLSALREHAVAQHSLHKPLSPSSTSSARPLSSQPANRLEERLHSSAAALSALHAPSACAVASGWQLPLNISKRDGVYNFALSPACQLLYVTVSDSNVPDPDTYIGSIDLASGVEQWRVPFPYNSLDTFFLAPFFQLNAAGTMLYAQHIVSTHTDLCVGMWGLAVQKSVGKMVWNVSRCLRNALMVPGGLLFPGAASDGDDIVLLLSSSFVCSDDGLCNQFLPWTSIKASTGEVLYESEVTLSPLSLFTSLQMDGRYFSVQAVNITANVSDWSKVTAVFSMSDTGVFALQSSRVSERSSGAYDRTVYTLAAVTSSDTMMQAFLDQANGTIRDWLGWTVPEQQQRWQRSDDDILMCRWPTGYSCSHWLWLQPHPLNSSWAVATALGTQSGNDAWVIVAIYDTHTGDRIATSAPLGPQQLGLGNVSPRLARFVHSDSSHNSGLRLVQTVQEGVYVLDVVSLALQLSGQAGTGEVNPLVLSIEGGEASVLGGGVSFLQGWIMTLSNASSSATAIE